MLRNITQLSLALTAGSQACWLCWLLAAAGQTLATVTAGRKDVDQISMGIFTALSLWKQAEHVGVREKEEGMRTRWILEEAGMLTLEGLVPN